MGARPTWRDLGGLGAAVIAVVALLLPWTTLSSGNADVQAALAMLPAEDVTRSVWRATFLGWFPPLLVAAIGLTVTVAGRVSAARTGGLPQVWLIAAVLAALSTAFAWIFIGWQFGGQERGILEAGGVSISAASGRYVGAVAVAACLVFAILDVRALRAEASRHRAGSARRGRGR